MKTALTIMAMGLASLPVFSQANNSAYNINSRLIDLDQKARAFGLTEAEYEDTDGMPYATKEFMPGAIYEGENVAAANVSLRYNIFADEIEIKNPGSTEGNYKALIKDPNIYVKIFKDLYIFVPFEGSVAKGGYFEILTDGDHYDLYKKSTTIYTPPVAGKTTYDRDHRASFTQTDTYYLVSEKGDFYELPNSKSKILKVMAQKESEVKKYIKAQDLDLDKEADLQKLVTYFNSIL